MRVAYCCCSTRLERRDSVSSLSGQVRACHRPVGSGRANRRPGPNDKSESEQIDKLTAIHYYGKKRAGRKVPSLTDEQLKNTPPVPHPVVRTHDETGTKALYVHETMTDYVADMEPPASEALLRRLYDHSTQNADFQYHHQWRTGDFVIWDNRATLHAATPDYAEHEKRLLYRTMIKGGATH
ncbi:MAG: TauD/TfdA dioxygenase family protein [Burkholderiales bacterium]